MSRRRSKERNSAPAAAIPRSSSCDELFILKRNSQPSIENSASSFKSTDDLPASVAECFQDSSVLGRIQNSLLLFIGRGSRYKLKSTSGCSFLSMIGQKKKQEEKSSLALLSPVTTDSRTSTASRSTLKLPLKHGNSLPARCKASKASLPSPTQVNKAFKEDQAVDAQAEGGGGGDGSKYSYTDKEERVPYRQEETLLRQYLSLQQLAIARRHCNRLRRIRDSLAGRIKLQTRVTPPTEEQEKLRNFLLDVGFVQYYTLLNRHGYDFVTATHMDVLDLAAVGINEPLHRMALKYELDQVRCPITPLRNIPETISEWLESISLPEYLEHFQQNGIFCPLAAVGLTKRDLQLMGIYMLGHRKKLVIALTAVSMGLTCKGISNEKES